MSVYAQRGVSAGKEEVHAAVAGLDKGLYPNAFCKILADFACGNEDYCSLMHADTAGTKPSLAYIYWRETGDMSVWAGIAQDAIVMNVDDMACVGLTSGIALSSTIGRNKHLIPGEVLREIIHANEAFAAAMRGFDIDITMAGGETADVGDIVRTIDVGITAYGRMRRDALVHIEPRVGDVVVGFGGYGQTTYEQEYNSGIGSNGLTGARHDLLHHDYFHKYPDSCDPNTAEQHLYTGRYLLGDTIAVPGVGDVPLGKLMLSPTRTFLPLLHRLVPKLGDGLCGLVHNTGGAQRKAAHFLRGIRMIKSDLLPLPPLFATIAADNDMTPAELYQVYNMGTRLEAYVRPDAAEAALALAAELNIPAQVIGEFATGEPGVEVRTHNGEWLRYPLAE